ncbi:MAG: acyl dehydratase [Saprospiraceae bacterium]|jgi:acyl dehydratase|tara:strand:- start:40 stop:507 length:468 start_codon:yes stop_codon:yes gene_type:complete
MTIDFKDQEQLNTLVSEEFSEWSSPLAVTQRMIDAFAELSGDKLWIHVDPERCEKQSPFKTTIAHGFLILSLLPSMRTGDDVTQKVSGYTQVMNYGSDKLRFMQPVPVDSEIHARNRVIGVEVSERKTVITLETQVQLLNSEKPSLIYQLSLVLM